MSHTLWVGLGVLAGRLSGFVREVSLAGHLGVTPEADIAVVLLTAPDVLTNLLMGGALSIALIPQFKRFGPGLRSQALFLKGSAATGLLFALVAALASHHADVLLRLLAPGLAGGYVEQAEGLLAKVLWVIPLTALAGVTTAYLQAHDRFFMPAMGTFIFNFVVVVALLGWVDGPDGLIWLVIAITSAAGIRWLSQLFGVPWRRTAIRRSLSWPIFNRALLFRYLQALGAGGAISLLPVIARAFASDQGAGNLALFNYAHKLVEFPLGVSVTVLSVAIFPMLSYSFSRGEDATVAISTALRWVLVLSLAMMFSLRLFSDLFAQIAFGWGKMNHGNVRAIGGLFAIGLLSLPFQGLSSLLLAIFNAKGDTATPLRVNIWALVGFFPISLWLSRWYEIAGVMGGMVLVYACLLAAQAYLLYSRHDLALWRLLSPLRVVMLVITLAVTTSLVKILIPCLVGAPLVSLIVAIATGMVFLLVGLICMGDAKFLAFYPARRDS